MTEIDFKPDSGESRMHSPSLFQQLEPYSTQVFQQQRTESTSLKELGFPDLNIVETSAGHPGDALTKLSAAVEQSQRTPADHLQGTRADRWQRSPLDQLQVVERHHRPTTQIMSSRELHLGLLAKAIGVDVTRNRDGSYDVKTPFDSPQQAASGILNRVFNGLVGGSHDGSAPAGMNWWHARAWQGFPEDPRTRQQQDARRRQEEQQAKQRWERAGR